MYHFFVRPEQIGETQIVIEGGDVNHIRNVLRMAVGEEITVSSGEDARVYRCGIRGMDGDSVTAEIMWVEEPERELPSRICLFQGLPKGDKMEMIIQKAVELGAAEIVPMTTRRSIVKLDRKKEESKRKRWNAIAESAAKQSRRLIVPEVKPVMSFSEALSYAASFQVKLFPYELAEDMQKTKGMVSSIEPGQSIAVFIGPEGGFDRQEAELAREAGAGWMTLGKRILRTETAGMAVLSILMFHLEGIATIHS